MSSRRLKVGELRPSQMLFSSGIGAIVDLPNVSVMVMGLDDWDDLEAPVLTEKRLLAAIRKFLGPQLEKLLAPPIVDDSGIVTPFDDRALVGVPVAPFPRWMVCPACRRLSPLGEGRFELKPDVYRPDRTCYVHSHCTRARKAPSVFPARFLIACQRGHLDDFPWLFFVHRGKSSCPGPLRLEETGPSGEARDVMVICEGCQKVRRMTEAFGDEGLKNLPRCRGRRIHLRDEEQEPCQEQLRTILIGASNIWFPAMISVLSIPTSDDKLEQLVNELWLDHLQHVTDKDVLEAFLKTPALRRLTEFPLDGVWEAIERRRDGTLEEIEPEDLKEREWEIFSNPDGAASSSDFRLRVVLPPDKFKQCIERVVLAERLREVRALTGFTRIESPGDLLEGGQNVLAYLVPLCRGKPKWVPATEVRGEGLFIQFKESTITRWLSSTKGLSQRAVEFLSAHEKWRRMRGVEPAQAGFPGIRYVLLHSFAHALMRQLSLDCGYSAASLRERIYSREPSQESGPMTGILLYTAAPDSEGTLGGLVALGEPAELGQYIEAALHEASLCACDPLCSEHKPSPDGLTLHAASCHACLFGSETSCECGNRYLDRAVLTDTIGGSDLAFFK